MTSPRAVAVPLIAAVALSVVGCAPRMEALTGSGAQTSTDMSFDEGSRLGLDDAQEVSSGASPHFVTSLPFDTSWSETPALPNSGLRRFVHDSTGCELLLAHGEQEFDAGGDREASHDLVETYARQQIGFELEVESVNGMQGTPPIAFAAARRDQAGRSQLILARAFSSADTYLMIVALCPPDLPADIFFWSYVQNYVGVRFETDAREESRG